MRRSAASASSADSPPDVVELQRRYRFGAPFLALGILFQTVGYTLPGDRGNVAAWGAALAAIALVWLSRTAVLRLRTRTGTSLLIVAVLAIAIVAGSVSGIVTGQLDPATLPTFPGRLLTVVLCFGAALVLPWRVGAQATLCAVAWAIDVAVSRLVRGDFAYLPSATNIALVIGSAASIVAAYELDANRRRRDLAEDALRAAKEAAERASAAKTAFLADMSHEIRSPMNVVIGMLDMVLDSDLTDEQRYDLGRARAGAVGLLGIVNDVLDAAKIEAGKLALESVEMDVPAVLSDTVATLSPQATAKNLTLRVQVAPDVPRVVLGDPVRFRQIVVNLVGNAIKFTGSGGVTVSAVPVGAGALPVVQVSVQDTGIGMSSDTLARIFEPFEQAAVSTTRSYGGSGLGLTISRRLVGLMDGRIWAESVPGQGSTFHFTARFALPARDDVAASSADSTAARPLASKAA